jgi:hypothetical protein
MASASTTNLKRATRKKTRKHTQKLSNAQLLKIAARSRPPQSWYDETTDPTKPQKR